MSTWLCMSARKLRFRGRVQIATVVVLLLCATFAWGQSTNTGTVIGVITDPSGAVVPGVSITLTDVNTHSTLTTTTNGSGRFVLVNVPPSTYDITATKAGFAVGKIAAQAVRVGTQSNANIQLSVGQQQQVVEVQASGTELQTLNATVGSAVSGVALESLPSLGRDVSTFATLQPGVSPDGAVAGTVVDNSSFQLDGGNNTNDMDGSMSVYTPTFAGDPTGGAGAGYQPTGVMPTPADSVEEFKVNTANQTADFNSSSGMQVQVVTKRGTNTVHGSVYEYYFDNNFNANTWDNNATGTKRPSYHRSRFGASLGGTVLPTMLGGKTYLFGNYQGFRWPNSATYERIVPSADMRNGFLTFGGTRFNIASIDPRGKGINPLIQQMWNKYEPPANNLNCTFTSRCDGANVQSFKANVALPQKDNFGVARLDHDFGSKWHFMSSYRIYKLTRASTSQVDIGGFFPGDTLGVPAAVSSRPQQPWYYVAGLTTNITPSLTNDIHYSYLRNYWSWSDNEDKPQFSQLGGALEPFGESATVVMAPYNLNTQSVRTRFWDGKDHMLRDDLTWLKGNHLMQFGFTYQHNFDYHQRSDNGGGINYQPVYQLGTSAGAGITMPAGIGAAEGRDIAAMMGIVSIAQTAYTRQGSDLHLNPPNTHAFDQSTIPFYNFYATDTWHMKPSLSLTYGLGWTLELPPTEANGKQMELVDSSGKPVDTIAYLNARKSAALQGQVYNPLLGWSLLANTAGKPKYPYNPYYKEFSPRVAMAWNPSFDSNSMMGKLFGGNNSVIRGGYGRIYGRLNGVDLVLVPLLGVGLIQAVQCKGPTITGACAGSGANLNNAFRVGIDGNTAPLPAPAPTLPALNTPGINSVAGGAAEGLDPNFRPNVTDTFTFSIQRQLNQKMTLELGYIGRKITHEYQPLNLNAVPTMMTLGGQTFAKAYAGIEVALGCAKSVAACGANVPSGGAAYTAFLNSLPKQPFFEAAMKPGFCTGYTSCTAAVVDNELSNFTSQSVWSLYSDLDNGGFNFARSMQNTPIPGSAFGANGQTSSGVALNAAVGYGNYNAGYFTIKSNDWHGITTQQNFTYSKSLGTGAVVQASSEYTADDPYNLSLMYGRQPFDRKFVYNVFVVYQPTWYKNQAGFLGRVLGGWTFAPVYAAGSGAPQTIFPTNTGGGYYGGQAFGEGDSVNYFSNEGAVWTGKPPSVGVHYGVKGSGGIGTGGYGVNMFKDPAAMWSQVRDPILGLDTFRNGGLGMISGLGYWNMDLGIRKQIRIAERVNFEFNAIFTNLLNNVTFADNNYFFEQGNLDATAPDQFGVLSSQANTPRQMEFGFRINW